MAIVQGPRLWIGTQDGEVSAVAFYDDADGQPARIDTLRSTLSEYEVELKGGPTTQEMTFIPALGQSSRNVPAATSRDIDMRPDTETFENLSEMTFTLRK